MKFCFSLLMLLIGINIFCYENSYINDGPGNQELARGDRFASFFTGRYTDDYLARNVIILRDITYDNSWIMGFTASQIISDIRTNYFWELELQTAKHFGEQRHWEFNGVFIYRWHNFPWNNIIYSTFGFGEGISVATQVPVLEKKSHTNRGAARTLNYLLFEKTLSQSNLSQWQLYLRIHHRSGVFGLFNGVRGGSNLICIGLKHRL